MTEPKICMIDPAFFTDKQNLNEINQDEKRPYLALKISIDTNDYYIPFESRLHMHPGLNNKSLICLPYQTDEDDFPTAGINFEKTLIINDPEYIIETGSVRNNQFNGIILRWDFIIRQFEKYIKDYIFFTQRGGNMPFRFKYSTLVYFHDELNI